MPTETNGERRVVFSGRRDRVLPVLGAVPRAAAALPVRQGLAVLPAGQRAAVHDRGLLLLLLVHGQPDTVQPDVDEIQARVPRDAVPGTGEEPDIPGTAVELPRHDRAAEHDDQHHRVPEVGVRQTGQELPVRGLQPAVGRGAFRRRPKLSVRGRRRAGHDLARVQRQRAGLQDVAEGHRGLQTRERSRRSQRRQRHRRVSRHQPRQSRSPKRKPAMFRNRDLHLSINNMFNT